MSQNNISIIGAGSAGLILAGNLIKKFDKIEIFESSNKIGGVTRDFYNESGTLFFTGCHYLHSSYLPGWIYDLDNLQKFEHRYSSLTEQNKIWNYKFNFAGPSFKIKELQQNFSGKKIVTLHDRLTLYPKEIAQTLTEHIKKFTSVSTELLHVSGVDSLGIARISSFSNDLELARIKQKNKLVDEMYGVSREFLGMKFETSYLPKFGFSKFWLEYLKNLHLKDQVIVNLDSKLDKKYFTNNSVNSISTLKAWCADPRQMIQLSTNEKLDSLSYTVHSYGIALTSYSGPSLPFYINIFSPSHPIIRLFFYELDSEIKVSVDSLQKYDLQNEIVLQLVSLSSKANIGFKISDLDFAYKKSRRYFPMSTRDYKILKKSAGTLTKLNWLDTGTYLFGRSSRFQLILNQV
jgi:hypothetical protein